jgi:uncharacterized membrane protein
MALTKGRWRTEMLHTVDVDVLIKRPVEEVWNYWVNIENIPYWAHNIKEVHQITEGPQDVGTRCVWNMTFLGKQFSQTMEFIEQVPFKVGALKSLDGPGNVTYRYTFEPFPGGTRIMAHAEVEPNEGYFKVAIPVVVAVFKRQLKASVENLKDIVETEALVTA